MIGGWQWVIILVVVLLLFGSRIPGIARSLGSGITEFRRGLKDGHDRSDGDRAGGDKVDKAGKADKLDNTDPADAADKSARSDAGRDG